MFRSRVHGKWILAGEHSVIRGGEALVFPVRSRFLEVEYSRDSCSLTVELVATETRSQGGQEGFWKVFDLALKKLEIEKKSLTGRLKLTNSIPIGAGMGASATLCVALSQWLAHLGYLNQDNIFNFAWDLENIFHGTSSGVDVAVALYNRPLVFKGPKDWVFFSPQWEPHFYLSYSGVPSSTQECVSQVKNLFRIDPKLAADLDRKMIHLTQIAGEVLIQDRDLPRLIEVVNGAHDCFQQWGLVGSELKQHMKTLTNQGALACKPTGSGQGGFVLSLWTQTIKPNELESLPFNMISCF